MSCLIYVFLISCIPLDSFFASLFHLNCKVLSKRHMLLRSILQLMHLSLLYSGCHKFVCMDSCVKIIYFFDSLTCYTGQTSSPTSKTLLKELFPCTIYVQFISSLMRYKSDSNYIYVTMTDLSQLSKICQQQRCERCIQASFNCFAFAVDGGVSRK